MRILRPIAAALLALLAAPAAGAAIAAHQQADQARGTVAERQEIERILQADNLDTGRLTSRQVATTIRGIRRGGAPEDFWAAYQAHVRAWERAADAEEKAVGLMAEKSAELERAVADYLEAEAAIETTFEEVERIARSYGAALPAPIESIEGTV